MSEVFEIKCGICNKIIKSAIKKSCCLFQFSSHLKQKHGLTKEKYLEIYKIPNQFIVDKHRARKNSGKFNIKCEICNRVFYSDEKRKCCANLFSHIRKIHKINLREYKKNNIIPESFYKEFNEHPCIISKEKYRDSKFPELQNKKTLEKIGKEEFESLPKCEICGLRSKQLYSHVAKIHGITVENYRKNHDGNLEEEKYLKCLSESRLGENNPMWNVGKSEYSPFSPEFYIKKGHDKKTAKKLAKDFQLKIRKEIPPEKQALKIEYYKNKYNIEDIEACNMLYKRQQTNSVENIAERHNISIAEAQKIRDNITKKWLKTMNSKPIEEINEINRKKIKGLAPTSTAANNFFRFLIEECNFLSKGNVLTNDNELVLSKIINDGIIKNYMYDFTYKNKIIEYNGDLFHANPSKYKADDIPITWIAMKKNSAYMRTAEKIWNYDREKIKVAEENNYEILIIWHSEIKKNKYEVLKKCKEFLLS